MNPRIMFWLAAVVLFGGCGGVELAPAEERDGYIGKVELAEVRVGKTMTGKFNVYGQVHNKGDRPLAQVMVKIDWLDQAGNSIGTATESCLTEVLMPSAMQEFKIPADSAPDGWAQKVDVKVAELAFGS